MNAVALVPARGGSKRVPRKNVRKLGSHPALAYTIASARESDVFAAILVSTDDPETASIARHYDAEVLLRPAALASDTSPDIEWVLHALRELAAAGRAFDAFAILRPTSPFRTAATIRRAWDLFGSDPSADSLRAVEACSQHPAKMWRFVEGGRRMRPVIEGRTDAGTPWHSTQYQALPQVYVQNASLEIARTHVALEDGTIAGEQIMPFQSQGLEGFDINDERDWHEAERLVVAGEVALPPVAAPPYPHSH